MSNPFEYAVIYNSRAKNLRLKVSHFGEIEVVSPPGINEFEIAGFVHSHSSWLHKVLSKIDRSHFLHPDLGLAPPANIYLGLTGEHFSLNYDSAISKQRVLETPGRLTVFTSSKKRQVDYLQQWIKAKARKELIPRLEEQANRLELTFNRVSIRNQRSRWGSCSHQKNINLNQNLIFLAPELTRYLMIHELCHLRYLNHSRRYWKLVEKYEPDFRLLDKQLSAAQKNLPLWAIR